MTDATVAIASQPHKLRLGVNIDHVATLRNARGGMLPDPIRAAQLAVAAGADGITAHLREDRRHIRDADMARLARELTVPLNFEMAVTDEMIDLATRLKPHAACLVPEKREERTTEGGLDIVSQHERVGDAVARLAQAGCRVSLFIEPDEAPIAMAARLGAPVVELHTGAWCEAVARGETSAAEAGFRRLAAGAVMARRFGLEVHAGHGLDYDTARRLASVPAFVEFNIGHFLIGDAVFIGLEGTIRRMRSAMDEGRVNAGQVKTGQGL